MKLIKKFAIATGAVLLCGFIFAVAVMLYMGRITKGAKIEKYENPRKALLVIDVQEDFCGASAGPRSPFRDTQKTIDIINGSVEAAAKKGFEIVYIRQEFDGTWGTLIGKTIFGGRALKGGPGTGMDRRVAVVSKNDFTKPIGDAFSNPGLDAFLVKNKINELYLTGLDAEYCVLSTARGALNRGYKVHILKDAILLSNQKKWNEIMDIYRKEGINLMTTSALSE